MKFAIRFIHFLTYSNIWIGFGAAALTSQFYLLSNTPLNYPLIAFAFFATLLTYTFQRYVKIMSGTRAGSDRINWMKRNNKFVNGLMVVATVGTVYPLYYFSLNSFWILGLIGTISFFYVVKIPGGWDRNLRDVPSLKIFLIALVWAVTGTWLPYFNIHEAGLESPWFLFLAEFVFIIALTIPFDIRDIELDEAEKKTIPQIIGEKWAIRISIILLVVYYFLLTNIPDGTLPFTLAFTYLAIILIKRSNQYRNDLYYSFIIDGLLILQPLLLLVDYALKTSI